MGRAQKIWGLEIQRACPMLYYSWLLAEASPTLPAIHHPLLGFLNGEIEGCS